MQRLLKSGPVRAVLPDAETRHYVNWTNALRDSASDLNEGFLGDNPDQAEEICCHRLERRLLADCSGGNSRLSYLLRCGGRSFFDQVLASQI